MIQDILQVFTIRSIINVNIKHQYYSNRSDRSHTLFIDIDLFTVSFNIIENLVLSFSNQIYD